MPRQTPRSREHDRVVTLRFPPAPRAGTQRDVLEGCRGRTGHPTAGSGGATAGVCGRGHRQRGRGGEGAGGERTGRWGDAGGRDVGRFRPGEHRGGRRRQRHPGGGLAAAVRGVHHLQVAGGRERHRGARLVRLSRAGTVGAGPPESTGGGDPLR
eukprot:ctg_1311.g447